MEEEGSTRLPALYFNSLLSPSHLYVPSLPLLSSLFQVYRGKLRQEFGGQQVAVKVQRPGVLESAALDVFIMRGGAMLFSKLPGMSDQWALALDDWALR